jgi:dCTP deaminase
MMLSNEDIKVVLSTGELVVDPFRPEFIRASSITMHLGHHLLKPLPGKVVDVKNKIVPDFEEIMIADEKPYPLQPGEFLLGHTYQKVTVGPNLGFFIEGRSTLARVGLTIVQTAMLVYPGHRARTVTLELANHGPNTILLYPKMKIARVALFQMKTPCSEQYDDKGKYRGQGIVGRPIFKDEILND